MRSSAVLVGLDHTNARVIREAKSHGDLAAHLDLGKIQMVYFTIVLVLAYAMAPATTFTSSGTRNRRASCARLRYGSMGQLSPCGLPTHKTIPPGGMRCDMGDRGRLWEPSIEEEGLSLSHPILRLNDGFDHTSPELRDKVKTLQTELNQEGFALEADGLFGRDTESAVKQFQREHDLDDDGIVGPLTWAALLRTAPPDLSTVFPTTFPQNHAALLAQFAQANTRYKAFIDDAAKQFGFQPSVIGGIGSRKLQ
jgi:hypothetical protein